MRGSTSKMWFKGFGVLPQQAETAVSGNAGNRSFESLWEQRHCLPLVSGIPDTNGYQEIYVIRNSRKEARSQEDFPAKISWLHFLTLKFLAWFTSIAFPVFPDYGERAQHHSRSKAARTFSLLAMYYCLNYNYYVTLKSSQRRILWEPCNQEIWA